MKNSSIIIILAFLFFIPAAKGQSTTENKKVVLRYIEEVINLRKLDLVNEIFAEKFIRHDLMENSEKVFTIADQRQSIAELIRVFPDLYYSVGEVIAEGDKVVMRAVMRGTPKESFMGIEPSGNRIDYISEIFFFRLENGKIVERWGQFDKYNLIKKMEGDKRKR